MVCMTAKLSLCLIVKNEAGNLRRCLSSTYGVVDEIIVVDTGSTDNTCEIAMEFGATVRHFPWSENFSDARNFSLEKATGEWILFLDADEELAKESREALLSLTADNAVEGYFVKIINYLGNEGWMETCSDMVFRLFRNRPGYRFRGAIHEQIADVIMEKNHKAVFRMAEEIVIIHYGYLDRQIDEKDKKNRNLKLMQKELGQNPENRLLRYHYGVELFRAERYAEAVGELTKVAEGIDPNTIYLPKLIRYIVLAYQSAGQPDKALEVAQQGLRVFPNYADLFYYSGLLYLDLKQYARAGESFQKAISIPEQPIHYASFSGVKGFRAYFYLGHIAEIFLNYEEALKFYMLSMRNNQGFVPALERIVHILKPRENPEYSKASLEKFFDFCTPRANLMMGEIYFREEAYQLAFEYLENGTESGANPEIQLSKVICLIQMRRYLEALRIIDSYAPESKLYPLAKLNELFCFWVQGNKKKVRAIFTELSSLGLAEDTEKVLALFLYAPVKRKNFNKVPLGQAGLALLLDIIKRLLDLKEVNKALQLLNGVSQKSLVAHKLNLGQIFYEYGFNELARESLQEYLTLGDDGETHFLLAEIHHKDGNYTEAEQHYRYAVELNPDEPHYYIRLINLYENKRKQILREAVEKYPDIEVFRKLEEEPGT